MHCINSLIQCIKPRYAYQFIGAGTQGAVIHEDHVVILGFLMIAFGLGKSRFHIGIGLVYRHIRVALIPLFHKKAAFITPLFRVEDHPRRIIETASGKPAQQVDIPAIKGRPARWDKTEMDRSIVRLEQRIVLFSCLEDEIAVKVPVKKVLFAASIPIRFDNDVRTHFTGADGLYPVALIPEALQIYPPPFGPAFEIYEIGVVELQVVVDGKLRFEVSHDIVPSIVLNDVDLYLIQRIGRIDRRGVQPELDILEGPRQFSALRLHKLALNGNPGIDD